MNNSWWFGINNLTKRRKSSGHVLFSEIKPFIDRDIIEFRWPYGGSAYSLKYYKEIKVGDNVVLWMGDGELKEWGIISLARILDIVNTENGKQEYILTHFIPHTKNILTPYQSKHPEQQIDADLFVDIFGLEFKPLKDVYVKLGYSKKRTTPVTIEKITNKQFENVCQKICFIKTDIKEYEKELYNQVKGSLKIDHNELLKKISKGREIPETKQVVQTVYNRNSAVIAYVLQKANGICQECKNSAPFLRRSDNTPYLEVHHKKPLANGGEDTIENTVALCPNCHRKMHYA